MARQIVVLFLVFFAVIGVASAAIDPHAADLSPSAADAPSQETKGGSDVIGPTDGSYNADAASIGSPVSSDAYPGLSPAESPHSGATIVGVASFASSTALAAASCSLFF